MNHPLPADASPAAVSAYEAIVEVHEDEGVYLDATTSNWPQLVIVQGYARDYAGSITYAITESGVVTIERMHEREDSRSGYLRAIRRTIDESDPFPTYLSEHGINA